VVVSEAKDEASLAAAIEELRTRDKVLDHLVEVAGPIHHRPRAGGGHFSALARAIVFQQLSGTVVQAIFGHLESAVGGEVTAESIAATADAELLGAGLSTPSWLRSGISRPRSSTGAWTSRDRRAR
jgi:3-methyladenine DNA glycosylase/8-oxoguanine DNA glycosylase